MHIKKLTFSSLLVAFGTLAGHLVYIPIGVSKVFPIQHTINVLSAVWLGPFYAILNAFIISLLRNLLGTGSILAFPGSIFGAIIASLLFKKTAKHYFAVIGEIFGTGIVGGIIAFPIAKYLLGSSATAFFFIPPFLMSTICGSIIAFALLKMLPEKKLLFKEV